MTECFILMILDPTMEENNATPHCRALCDQFEALFFHRDFATWNSPHSAVVRTMRAVIAAKGGRSLTSGFPWHSIMCLAFNREAVDQITASYKVLFSHPVREASIVSLMDEFEKLKPRNGDSRKQEAFEKLIHTAMAA